ncbi:unnamed protein product [Camellia sinensis]
MSPPGGGTCSCSSIENKDDLGDGFDKLNDRRCPHCRRSHLPSSSSSSSLLSFDSVPLEDYDKLWRIFTASVKGFTIGAGIKGGLSLFAVLTRFRRRRLSTSSKNAVMASSSEDVILAIKETIRYGLFLGTFAGTFVSVDEIIATLGGHRRTARWRALFAGAVAGNSLLLTGLDTQHTSLAIYILMRAAVLASRCGIKSKRLGRICKPLTWAHGDIFLMCLSSSQILSAYLLKQESLPSSYKSFLNKHGGKDPIVLQGVREMACGMPFSNLGVIEKYYKTIGVNIKLDPQMKIPCSTYTWKSIMWCTFCIISYPSLQKSITSLFSSLFDPCTNSSPERPLEKAWLDFGERSIWYGKIKLVSVRLLLVCLVTTMWTCFLFRLLKRCNVPMVAIGTFPTGLALAIEKKSRRIEISLYCLARAIESFVTCMSDIGYLPESRRLKRADVVVFSISTAIIMHCYAIERDVFRSKYLNVLDWVFGVPLSPSETPRKRSSVIDYAKDEGFSCVKDLHPKFLVVDSSHACQGNSDVVANGLNKLGEASLQLEKPTGRCCWASMSLPRYRHR